MSKGATNPISVETSVPAPDPASVAWFASAARRLSAATRAAGLVVPAFRCPPRIPGVPRTIKRYLGGAVISVVILGRSSTEVLIDLVEGILVVNSLEGEAAVRFRRALLDAAGGLPDRSGDNLLSGDARVAERQTQAA
ncbi:MAG: hypothetical protein JHD17_05800 [Acidimicrobiia bacterium]|nr:hypothetical protein [Acidimicrobiia bacterium]MCX6504563.1 hypothetical protein [Actinomycetota bacterium]MSV94501.1 hypothetical protein [Actinomycetota bacterium]